MFPMTVTLRSYAELEAVLSAVRAIAPSPVSFGEIHPDPAPTARVFDATQPEPTTNDTPVIEAPKALASVPIGVRTAEHASVPAKTEAPASEPKATPTYDETAGAIIKLSKAKGAQTAREVLARFGINRLPEATPEQYADILAACEAA